jgi:recombination protein RecT
MLLLRDTPAGLEVLMTRRSDKASFVPGAYVFPGGRIDPEDAQCHALTQRRASQNDAHLTAAVAAIRESFEELGVLLARRPDGSLAGQADIEQLVRCEPFAAQCQQHGLRLVTDEIYVLAHWVTDRERGQRFDVPFLVARMPEGQQPVADESEQFEPVWLRPADALARHAAGNFFMIFPTIRTLDHLQRYRDVEAVLQACAVSEDPLWSCCPRAGLLAGREHRLMDHDSAFGELALVCPDGHIAHPLDWQSEQPVALLKNLQRLTAPNPGMMTGPGTNSYLVGDARTGFAVIDPGPDDTAHLQRLWEATDGDIRMIVCTHSHPDHSPGARRLQAMCASTPPVLGLSSAPTARADSFFQPDRELDDGEVLRLQAGADGQHAGLTHSLQVIHTPGHAANHLCLLLQEDGLLFSGDHILNGSTTVVNPPDGHMSDYLDSLDTLHRICQAQDVHFIAPAHGYVMGGPEDQVLQAIGQLKQHRLQREAKVLRAMQTLPQGDLDDWLPLVYNDVPERLWPVARRSLMAHVERLQALQP